MRVTPIRTVAKRRSVLGLVAMVIAFFVIANLTAKNAGHPGAVSNVAFIASVLGVVLLVLLGLSTLVDSRRRAR